MTSSGQDARDWTDRVGDWIAARWRWLVAGALLIFALNNIAGFLVGALGLIAFVNRIAGRVLGAKRVVDHVKQIANDRDDRDSPA
ncbi:MAG TPA: hypothetical protein EYQ27_04550 [Gemmatimonadetes bacterium]|nr:hypothetical protein [Gemmatimonadota bacterium]